MPLSLVFGLSSATWNALHHRTLSSANCAARIDDRLRQGLVAVNMIVKALSRRRRLLSVAKARARLR
jgi:hypothetical protein